MRQNQDYSVLYSMYYMYLYEWVALTFLKPILVVKTLRLIEYNKKHN